MDQTPPNFRSDPYDRVPLEEPMQSRVPWEAMLAYVPIFCLYPWAIQDSVPGLKPHARQGMILFVIELIIVLIRTDFVYRMLWLVMLILAALGAWAAFQGMPYRLPLIADFVDSVFKPKPKVQEEEQPPMGWDD